MTGSCARLTPFDGRTENAFNGMGLCATLVTGGSDCGMRARHKPSYSQPSSSSKSKRLWALTNFGGILKTQGRKEKAFSQFDSNENAMPVGEASDAFKGSICEPARSPNTREAAQ